MKKLALALLVLAACKHDATRCARCGMKIDPASPWNADLGEEHFDSPRCALSTWLEHQKRGTVRVQDYYDRTFHPADEVRFVVGSDVVGPMGPDLVPVDPTRVAKFEKDHGGTRALALTDVDEKALLP